jgi:hypothetical protein
MQNGDLSNEIPRRILFIWEAGLGKVPKSAVRMEKRSCKRQHWDDAANRWELDQHGVAVVWDYWQRYDLRCDLIVTTRPPAFAAALQDRLERENVPIRYTAAMEAAQLGRRLAYMPDVLHVVYDDENLRWMFGAKGLPLI